jgi:hypothetical protein
MKVGLTANRNPVDFSNSLRELEENYKQHKDAVLNLRKHLLWKEVAKKHILLYNSIIDNASPPLLEN